MRRLSHSVRVWAQGGRPGKAERGRQEKAGPVRQKGAGREEMKRIDDEPGRGGHSSSILSFDMMRSNARGPVDLRALLPFGMMMRSAERRPGGPLLSTFRFWIMMMRRDERGRRRDLRSSLFVFHRKADLVHRERRDRALRVSVHQVRTGRRPVAVPVQLNYLPRAHAIPYA